MDAKYLAEIKARAQAAKAEKQKGNAMNCACLSWAIVLNDLPALLAEVERLQNCKCVDKCGLVCLLDKYDAAKAEIATLKDCAIRGVGYVKKYHAALVDLDVKDQQIATLKKALELAEDMLTKMTPFKSKGGWHDRLIQRAQEGKK